MNTKTCSGCGWVYPIQYNKPKCRFCGTAFEKRVCKDCGTYTKLLPGTAICSKCKYRRDIIYTRGDECAHLLKAEKDLHDWLELVRKAKFNTLTQEEWLRACKHFGKCAMCPSESIDARGFFLPFKMGGRYAAWNIVPVCEFCATELKKHDNIFLTHNVGIAVARNNITKYVMRNNYKNDNFLRTVEYLKPLLKEAANNK